MARATDNLGAATTSAVVSVTVDAPPTVSLTAPANNAVYAAPANIALAASAADAVGILTKVDFYQGTTLIGTATAAPYVFTWTNVAAGLYTLTAVATNDAGMTSTSAAVAIAVDAPPAVALTAPANGASFTAPTNIPIAASASDTVGTVTRVDFYQGTTLIGSASASPFSFTWANVAAGTYSLTAVATNNAGQTATSAAISITVRSAVAQMYYVHVDHLNTPRLVANAAGATVWRWDQQEPFGVNVPDENPSGLGAFEFSMRFPGQYFDKETNLHHNDFRDYDPVRGRYEQSDLIGLRGGINTYAYVDNNPVSFADPLGLLRFPSKLPGPNWYGNWCGPGGRGSPIDCIDRACKNHDECYDACGLRAGNRWFPPSLWSPCGAKCDREFATDINNCRKGACEKPQ
jgi:RHS repeat-associated protein